MARNHKDLNAPIWVVVWFKGPICMLRGMYLELWRLPTTMMWHRASFSIHFAWPSSMFWRYTSFTTRSMMFKFNAVETRVTMARSLLKTRIILNYSSSSLCAEPTGLLLAILRKDSTVCCMPIIYHRTFLPWYHGISFPSSRIFSSMAGILSMTTSILLFPGLGFLFSGSA